MSEPQPSQSAQSASRPPDVQWACVVEAREGVELTVGEKFVLKCEGPPAGLESANLSLEIAPDAKFALRLLEAKSLGDAKGEFIATSWMAGELKILNPILTDGKKRVGLGEIKVNVKSILNPQENPENKPYEPWGPLALPLPVYVWLMAVMIFAAIGIVTISLLRRRLKRKRFLELLNKNRSALSPYNQFNKDLRKIGRDTSLLEAKDVIKEINDAFRWFIARQLQIPSIDSRAGEVASEMKHQHKALLEKDRKLHRDLKVALLEIEKAMSSTKPVPQEDILQLSEICRGLADRIVNANTNTGGASR